MRRSDIYIAVMLMGIASIAVLFMHAAYAEKASSAHIALERGIVRNYMLTDIALFTEARYTRHPSMADLNTPFQDYPFSFEHFPSGSLMPLPPGMRAAGRQR